MFIPKEKYKEIIDLIPICCIDFFIVHENSILLGKRNNEPLKGEWFVPGGRIFKSETQDKAIQRKLFEETGIHIHTDVVSLLGVYDTIFDKNVLSENQITHTINITYIVKIDKKDEIDIVCDNQNEELRWFDMDTNSELINNYIKKLISDYKENAKRK